MSDKLNSKTVKIINHIEKLTGLNIKNYCTKGKRPMSYFNLDIYEMEKKEKIASKRITLIIERIARDHQFSISENGGFGLAICFKK